jgi:hypothetical protein
MSDELPKFVGRLRAKGVILFTVNQLRDIPMARYGPTQKEPGGNALKFYSAVRNRMFSRVPPSGWDRDPDNGQICLEPSVFGEGKFDAYSFKSFRNFKNKMGKPFLKTMGRVWISDYGGTMRGFDPYFDTLNYLLQTGQIEGTKKGYTFNFIAEGSPKMWDGMKQLSETTVTKDDLKLLTVAEHLKDKELKAKAYKKLGMQKSPQLRKWLFGQVQSNKALWSSDSAEAAEDLE